MLRMGEHVGAGDSLAAAGAKIRLGAQRGEAAAVEQTCQVWNGASSADINAAAAALARGEPVAFPTETVYGLGALAASDAAVANIFAAKGRPSDNPLIVHFADGHAGLQQLAMDGKVPPEATALAEAFWPGPLSICIRANPKAVSATCRAGLTSVAVRVPEHRVALELLEALDRKMGCATGVAAPSANASGRPSPTAALHVLEDLGAGHKIAGVVDGGRTCSIGIESTVVDCTVSPVAILRPGKISAADISRVLNQPVDEAEHSGQGGREATDDAAGQDSMGAMVEGPKAPGMKYRHYSPRAPLRVFEDCDAFLAAVASHRDRARSSCGNFSSGGRDDGQEPWLGIMAPAQVLARVGMVPGSVMVECGSSEEDLDSIAQDLFVALRAFDETPSVKLILALGCRAEGLGVGIRNRLDKASLGGHL